MKPIRLLVVDDVAIFRKILTDVLSEDPEIEVVDTAPNGKIALQKIKHYHPNLMILDIEMPEMDGISMLRQLRTMLNPPGVILFSAVTKAGAAKTIEALSFGAFDFVTKPAENLVASMQTIRNELLPKIHAYADGRLKTKGSFSTHAPEKPKRNTPPSFLSPMSLDSGVHEVKRGGRKELLRDRGIVSEPVMHKHVIGIAISTGGPGTLRSFFSKLPTYWKFPILIVQHMPAIFTGKLAESLNGITQYNVYEARSNMVVEPKTVYLAPGGLHMVVQQVGESVKIDLNNGPPVNSCRPSADVLFDSMAEVYNNRVLGMVFTGMGNDGTRGAAILKKHRSAVLCQNQESSVVWGMPRSVVESNLHDDQFDLNNVISVMERFLDFQVKF